MSLSSSSGLGWQLIVSMLALTLLAACLVGALCIRRRRRRANTPSTRTKPFAFRLARLRCGTVVMRREPFGRDPFKSAAPQGVVIGTPIESPSTVEPRGATRGARSATRSSWWMRMRRRRIERNRRIGDEMSI